MGTPYLQTILPDGTNENNKELKPVKEKAMICYAYHQSTTKEVVEKYPDSPFVWDRGDETYACVQTWPTSYNAKFKEDFQIEDENPDEEHFTEQAAEEFKRAVAKLFGLEEGDTPIRYCCRSTHNKDSLYRGSSAAIQALIRNNEEIRKELDIMEIIPNGFVSRTVNGKKEEGKKDFAFSGPEVEVGLYIKQGWETMACM